jgi:ketosteroid isomerase-like protein
MSYHNALNRYIDATNSHDFNNVKEVLHPNAIYWFTDQNCTSIEEIGSYFNNAWDIIKEEMYSATDVQWIAVSEQVATCIYTYNYTGYHNGKLVSGSGRATNVFTLFNNEWKLIHEHLSSL